MRVVQMHHHRNPHRMDRCSYHHHFVYTQDRFKQPFSYFGLPQLIVSDNGTAFTSLEFQTFAKSKSRILHRRSAPVLKWTSRASSRNTQRWSLKTIWTSRISIMSVPVSLPDYYPPIQQQVRTYDSENCIWI